MFSNIRHIDDSILDSIAQRKKLENLGVTPTITEVRNATKNMTNRKAIIENKVPQEGYKYLTNDTFSHLYDVVVEFWTGNDDPQYFHEAKLCIVEKNEISACLRTTCQYFSLMWSLKLSVLLLRICANQY